MCVSTTSSADNDDFLGFTQEFSKPNMRIPQERTPKTTTTTKMTLFISTASSADNDNDVDDVVVEVGSGRHDDDHKNDGLELRLVPQQRQS